MSQALFDAPPVNTEVLEPLINRLGISGEEGMRCVLGEGQHISQGRGKRALGHSDFGALQFSSFSGNSFNIAARNTDIGKVAVG